MSGTTTTTTGTEGTSAAATAAAATTTAAAATTTAATGTAATTAATTATTTAAEPAKWADDWRKSMAKGDEKGVKRLERYASPEAVFDALTAAQTKIDSGQIRPTLPDNATPEQLAEYRKATGVPESHDKYDTTIAEGHVWGEADKPILDSFLKASHDENASPTEVKRALKWYGSLAQQKAGEQQTADANFKNDSIAELGKRYGGEYKRNIAHVDAYLEEMSPGIKDKILGARLPNGRLAGSDPDFIDHLFKEAIFRNPIATVMGGNSEANVKAGETRLNELIKMSGDRSSEYHKGPNKAKLQQEHLDLIEGLEKIRAAKR